MKNEPSALWPLRVRETRRKQGGRKKFKDQSSREAQRAKLKTLRACLRAVLEFETFTFDLPLSFEL
jgi:hypothetical protein